MLNKKLFVIIIPILSQISCIGRHQPRPIIATQPQPFSVPEPYQQPQMPEAITPARTYRLKPTSQPTIHQKPPAPKTVIIEKKVSVPKPVIVRARPKVLSAAVIALVSIADKNIQSGQLEPAVVSLERALRIEPRSALLTYKLAELKLKQTKFRSAENLAQRSALLAAADTALKKKSWQLIVQSRRLQQDYEGAKKAQEKVERLN